MMWCRDDAKDTGNRRSSPSWSWGCVWALARAKLTPQKALGWSLGQNRPYRALRLQPTRETPRGEGGESGEQAVAREETKKAEKEARAEKKAEKAAKRLVLLEEALARKGGAEPRDGFSDEEEAFSS